MLEHVLFIQILADLVVNSSCTTLVKRSVEFDGLFRHQISSVWQGVILHLLLHLFKVTFVLC